MVAASLGDAQSASFMIDPHSAITDVAGIKVGHWTSTARPTGCTVVLAPPAGAVGGVDVRGSAPGTRETDLLNPENLVDRVNAIVLAGGSAFGLDAASGVVRWLDEHGIGYDVRIAKVPIVPAAILFDLAVGDPKIRPDAAAGYAACNAATSERPAEGNVGAGAGATVGKLFGFDRAMKSGIGTASVTLDGLVVGAIVAVNAIGDVIDPSQRAKSSRARAAQTERRRSTRCKRFSAAKFPRYLQRGRRRRSASLRPTPNSRKPKRKRSRKWRTTGSRARSRLRTRCSTAIRFSRWQPAAPRKPETRRCLDFMAAEVVVASILRAVNAARSLPGLPSAHDLR